MDVQPQNPEEQIHNRETLAWFVLCMHYSHASYRRCEQPDYSKQYHSGITATELTDENAESTEADKTVSFLSYSIPDIQM